MPPNERTPAESVACCNALGVQRATAGRIAQHLTQPSVQCLPASDLKTLANQALERIERRNSVRNTKRNDAVAGCCVGNEGTQHRAEHERTADDPTAWRDYFDERAAIREHDVGVSRADAEAGALTDCVARWRALNPLPASGDGVCVQCGKARPDTPVLARNGHAWLHRECWAPLNAGRNKLALAAVRALLGRAP